MLEESSQQEIMGIWHDQVFLPKFKELQCSFRFVMLPRGDIPHEPPSLCRVITKPKTVTVYYDHHCRETIDEIRVIPFRMNGCNVTAFELKVSMSDAQLQENYNMIELTTRERLKDEPLFRAYEEAFVVVRLKRMSELQQTFQAVQTDQGHNAKCFSVKTRLVGRTLELSWDLKDYARNGYLLRGYKNEVGFASEVSLFKDQGVCVVQAQCNGQSIQQLEAGREFYYTFILTRDEPVHEQQNFLQSIFSNAAVVGTKTRIVDTLCFSVRVPTPMEMAEVGRMLERVKETPVDPKREKINRAVNQLETFVEFSESLSDIQKILIKRIKSKKYSPDEEADRIEKLMSSVNSMLVDNQP